MRQYILPNKRISKSMKKCLTEINEEIDNPRVRLGKSFLSTINRTLDRKTSNDIEDLNHSVNHHESIAIEHCTQQLHKIHFLKHMWHIHKVDTIW